MKKIILLLALLLAGSVIFGVNLNVMTSSGEVVSGSLIGSDDSAIFIKAADGNAKTVKYSSISKIFDADTMKDVTAKYKGSSPAAKNEPAPKPAKKQEQAQDSGLEYETVEDSSGSINTRENVNIFTRTTSRCFDMGISLLQANVLFSGDNVRLKKLLKPYANNVGGYSYDDSTLMFSFGFNGYAYLRPIDGLAIGGFYGLSPMNQNFSVYRGSDKFMYIDMPLTEYGLLVKLIPFSEAKTGSDGELEDTFGFSVDLKIGAASLGTVFSNASINDETSAGDAVDLSGEAPYFAVELTLWSQPDLMLFGLGYQQCNFEGIKAAKPYTNGTYITEDGDGYLTDGQGKVPFSAQSVYLYMTLAF